MPTPRWPGSVWPTAPRTVPGSSPEASSSASRWPGRWWTEPAIILADEPTGNLDTASTADVLGLLDELHGSGRTIVLITHEHDVAARAERQLVISDGRITSDERREVLRGVAR